MRAIFFSGLGFENYMDSKYWSKEEDERLLKGIELYGLDDCLEKKEKVEYWKNISNIVRTRDHGKPFIKFLSDSKIHATIVY
jgi:hypothetical protein